MIPYWPQPVWTIGPIAIHAFGAAQAVALITGYALVSWRATAAGLDRVITARLFVATLLGGLAAGIAVRPGFSASGMIAGAIAVALAAWLRWGPEMLRHIDTLASAAPSVAAVARFGCFLAHDHRARPSSGLFAVRFPEGSRIDLGLFECVISLLAIVPIWLLWRRKLKPGVVTAVVIVSGLLVRLASAQFR